MTISCTFTGNYRDGSESDGSASGAATKSALTDIISKEPSYLTRLFCRTSSHCSSYRPRHSFPFLNLPAELRVMVCKWTLTGRKIKLSCRRKVLERNEAAIAPPKRRSKQPAKFGYVCETSAPFEPVILSACHMLHHEFMRPSRRSNFLTLRAHIFLSDRWTDSCRAPYLQNIRLVALTAVNFKDGFYSLPSQLPALKRVGMMDRCENVVNYEGNTVPTDEEVVQIMMQGLNSPNKSKYAKHLWSSQRSYNIILHGHRASNVIHNQTFYAMLCNSAPMASGGAAADFRLWQSTWTVTMCCTSAARNIRATPKVQKPLSVSVGQRQVRQGQ